MGDSVKAIREGAALAKELLTEFGPLLGGLFSFFANRTGNKQQAMQLMADHMTPGRPNAAEAGVDVAGERDDGSA